VTHRKLQAGLAAMWAIPALASVLETSAYARAVGRPMPFLVALVTRMPPWFVWALATPIVIDLVRREGASWPPRPRTVATHVALVSAIAVIHAFVYVTLSWLAPIRKAMPLPFHTMLWTELLGWIPVSLLAYAALVGIGVTLVLGRRTAQLEGALATAQLDALRAQIQPHFIFNVLNTIGVFVREGDRQRALRTIGLFGDTLRTVLRAESTHLITLADELSALAHYVAIEEVRYEDRVSVRWCIDPELATHPVPALIYQPVVENAFRHGVGLRPGASVVEIGARADATRLTLWVRESGATAGIEAPSALTPASNGIGLHNTAARLAALYGTAGHIAVRTNDQASIAEIEIPRCARSA
jgi:two-component system, LytTR family, sensor kinase